MEPTSTFFILCSAFTRAVKVLKTVWALLYAREQKECTPGEYRIQLIGGSMDIP